MNDKPPCGACGSFHEPEYKCAPGLRQTVANLERETSELRAELEAERRRRRFMQVHGRYLSWGPGSRRDTRGEPHVYFTDSDGDGPYRRVELELPQNGDRLAAQARIIDLAIERHDSHLARVDDQSGSA